MDYTDYTGNEYRLQKISEIQNKLETEMQERRQLENKYKKGVKVVNAVDYVLAVSIMGLSVVGVGLLSTVIAAPAVITTESMTVGVSMLLILSRQVNKKLVAKAKKHEKLGDMIEETLNKISNHISVALNDDNISTEEFSLILSEDNIYRETKEKLRAASKESVEPFLQRIRQALKKR